MKLLKDKNSKHVYDSIVPKNLAKSYIKAEYLQFIGWSVLTQVSTIFIVPKNLAKSYIKAEYLQFISWSVLTQATKKKTNTQRDHYQKINGQIIYPIYKRSQADR